MTRKFLDPPIRNGLVDEPVDSDLWERVVYGYFRNCYLPDSGSRKADDLIIRTWDCACGKSCTSRLKLQEHYAADGQDLSRHWTMDPPPPERHRAVDYIREFFPDHQPRIDLIIDPGKGYGAYECVKCHTVVQYDPEVDAFAVYRSHSADCPEGGRHEIE